MRKILRYNGTRGLYKGFVVTLYRDAPAFGYYFWAYEYLKRHWLPENSPLSILIAGKGEEEEGRGEPEGGEGRGRERERRGSSQGRSIGCLKILHSVF
jgi:hypothetical protein